TAANGNVTVATTVQPGPVVVNNNTLAYTFSGSPILGASSLVKNGSGTLTISNNNNFPAGAVINSGTVAFGNDAANSDGLGTNTITLNGGTLSMFDSPATAENVLWNLAVPNGATPTLNSDSRCNLYGSLTGNGTLNFTVTSTNTSLYGDWSPFTGRINVTGGGEFHVLNLSGYPNAAIALANTV